MGCASASRPAGGFRRARMTRLRPAAVAGLFYPDDPDALAAILARDLAVPVRDVETRRQAVMSRQAGSLSPGPIAGVGYARVERMKGLVQRVVLIGPLHSGWVEASPSAASTPSPRRSGR